MKAVVYSYKNRRPVIMELDRYYYVNNNKELNTIISNLLDLDFDAVLSPMLETIKFPAILKLDNGFGLNLKISSKDELATDLQRLRDVLDSVEG